MIKKLTRGKFVLILSFVFMIAMMTTACNSIDFKVNFIVDGQVYHTISTNGNEVVKMPADPSKEGYTFDGWFWDKDVWNKPFTANSLLDAPLSENMSVFAKWKEIVLQQTITVENPTYTGKALVYGDNLPTITTTTTGGTIALNAGQTLSVGTKEYNWTFVPADSENYNWLNTTGAIALTVGKATAMVATPIYSGGGLTYGDNLPTITTTTTGGAIALNAGQTLSVGTKEYNWTFVPADSENYNWQNTTGTISLTVQKASQTISVGSKLAVINVTESAIELANLGATYEYSIDNNIWQDLNSFSGLDSNTAYTLYARLKETDNFYPSPHISTTATTSKASGCEIISAEGFKIEGRNASRKISNATNTFSFINIIKVSQGATWQVSTDINGVNIIPTKTISLSEGDNTVFILVTAANGEDLCLYTFTIRRRPIYTVICQNADDSSFLTQSIEEDNFAIEPTNNPSKVGYDFSGWSFDFNAPITKSVDIEPKWSIITYTITYDNLLDGTNPNANIIDYTILSESIILDAPTKIGYTGAWDITRIDKGSIGNKIITASWTINKYTLATIKSFENAGCITTGGAYDYNSKQTITAVGNLGYKWLGWYNGSMLLTTAVSYTFNMPAENVTYEACWAIDEQLSNFTFSSTENTLTITKYNGAASEVVIPNSVTSIGTQAFSGCSGLTGVTIPSSVTSIGGGAFSSCSGLTSITIPFVGNTLNGTSNTHFGYIFGASSYSDNASSVPTSLKTVVITGGTSIRDWAFYGCSGLISIAIPSSVTSIYLSAFSGCSGLTSITVEVENTIYHSAGNCLIDTANKVLIAGCKTSVIPNSVTSIGQYAFRGCNGLTSITIPSSVTSIGSGAFYDCSGLTSITIPNSVTSIGDSAFYDCSGLTSITIPNSVTSIGDSAFSGCSGLTSITIPNSVTNIGYRAFSGCSGLTSINLPFVGNTLNGTSNTHFGYIFGASSYSDNAKYIPASLRTVIITVGTSIGSDAFNGCSGLTSITIGSSVTSIGSYAFAGCNGLTSITIPNSVTSIGTQAFYNCNGLTSITIGSGVTSLGDSAFSGFSGLTSITIGSGVTNIGDYAFADCSGLTSITIPNSVTSIGSYAFAGCNGLTSITIPNSVTSIGQSAFQYCSGLTLITVDEGNTTYSSHQGILMNKSKTEIILVPQSIKGDIVLPNSAISIGDYAFAGCSTLTSITIPNSVTSIGRSSFENCRGLTSITVEAKNTIYHSADNCLIDTSNKILIAGCKNSTIPTDGSVTSIGDSAFYGCSGLTSITIPNSVTSIGQYAFYACSGLTTVYIDSLAISNSINATSHGWLLYYATTIFIKDDLAFSNAYLNTLSCAGTETVNNIVYKKYIR